MEDLKIGILDIGNRANTNSLSALEDILSYATTCDQLGFSRFWLGEHHNSDPLTPYTNPDILLTMIAGMTESIRVGSAGTLISLYDPYSVATNYKLLNNMFNNRIDLGLSKGLPGNKHIFKLKGGHVTIDNAMTLFNQNVEKIHDLFYNEEDHFINHELIIPPYKGSIPAMCYLSGSYSNFPIAIKHNLNYCRTIFHGTIGTKIEFKKEELLSYKEQFYTHNNRYPEVSLAVAFHMEDTIEKATKIVDDLLNQPGINLSEAWNTIPVTPDTLEELLRNYQEQFGINEFILYDASLSSKKKMENVHEISQKFKLNNQLITEESSNFESALK